MRLKSILKKLKNSLTREEFKILGMGMSGCSFLIGMYILFMYILTSWTESNLEFWILYFKEEAVDVPTWLAFCVTCIPFSLPLNIISELVELCV